MRFPFAFCAKKWIVFILTFILYLNTKLRAIRSCRYRPCANVDLLLPWAPQYVPFVSPIVCSSRPLPWYASFVLLSTPLVTWSPSLQPQSYDEIQQKYLKRFPFIHKLVSNLFPPATHSEFASKIYFQLKTILLSRQKQFFPFESLHLGRRRNESLLK